MGAEGTPEDGDLQGPLTRDRVNDDDNYTGDQGQSTTISHRLPGGGGADTTPTPGLDTKRSLSLCWQGDPLVSVLGVGMGPGTPPRPSR